MLATLLLLAQLVLPGPPSGPIQPPGMICLGDCAGPVVWGQAERGRLVVACDMRSDTCSDGRKITTTRATPVPCEVAPGVWEMVGVDEGCYSVRGLESWAANTSYLAYGAELGLNPPWVPSATVSVAAVESFWRVCGEEPSNQLQNVTSWVDGEPVTASCIVRAATSGRMGIQSAPVAFGGSIVDYNLTSEWQTVSATTMLSGGTQAFARILPSRSGPGCIDAIGCWLTRTSIPGRACWGGEAPVTCAADRHTISTEGWPTTEGRVCIGFGFDHASSANRYLLDSRAGGEGVSLLLTGGQIVGRTYHQGSQVSVAGPSVPIGAHIACLEWDATTLRLRFDGQLMGESPHSPPASHRAAATVGYDTGGSNHLNGSIYSLTIRSFE